MEQTTVDDLSPGAKLMYELLRTESKEEYEARFLEHKKEVLDVVRVFVNDTRTQLRNGVVDNAGVPNPKRSPAMESSTSSPTRSTAVLSRVVSIDESKSDATKDDLHSVTPSTCSSKCPSNDAYTSMSVVISSATPSSPTTTCGIVPELATPAVSDTALDVDVAGDTSPTAAICLLADLDDGGEEDLVDVSLTPGNTPATFALPGVFEAMPMPLTPWSVHIDFNVPARNSPRPPRELFTWSPTACSAESSGHSIETPSRLLQASYKMFSVVPMVTTIAPWPPPNFTRVRTPSMHGHDLFYNAQQKRGKEFLIVWEMESPVAPPMQYVKYNQGKQSAKLLEVREDRHQFEGIQVVILQHPWLSPLGLCLDLPTGNVVFGFDSSTLIGAGMRPVCLQLEQLIMANIVALMYTFAHASTLHYHFSSGNLILLSTAAANSDMAQYLHCKGPQGTNESDCVASRYLVGVFPILGDWFLFYPTRKAFLPSFAKLQWKIAVVEWKTWTCSWAICLGVFAGGHDVPIPLCFQFGVKSSLSSQDELYPSITIVKLHGILVEVVELKPWSYWELVTCVSAVTRCLCGASHILPSSVLILTCTSSRSNYYCQVHILHASLTRLSTSVNLPAGKCYLLLRLYSSCDQFDSATATYLGSQFFEWQIPWYIGGNEGLVMQIAVKTTGLRPTKIPCCSLLIQSLVVLAAVLPVGEIGAQFTEPLLLAILSLKRHVQLKPSQFGGVHFRHVQQVVPRRVTVMSMRGNKILETLSLRANKTNGGGCSLCLVLPDVILHTILDSWAYEVCFCELKNYWDPGGIELQFSERAFLIWLVMPWDPGGYAWRRLEVKPNFKDGGLLATSPLGRYSLARPALKTQTTTTNTKERPHERGGLEKERTDGLGR